MNIGVQDGLLDPKHERVMGQAVWLYLWCIKSQTPKSNFVLGGMPLTYEEIERRSGFAARKIRRWLVVLRQSNYVRVSHLNYCMLRIEIMKPKKWAPKQGDLPFQKAQSLRPETVNTTVEELTENGQHVRPKTVNTATGNGQLKQTCILTCIESTTTTARPEGLAGLVPVKLWLDFLEVRKKKRVPHTQTAVDLLIRTLIELRDSGEDPIKVVERSVMNGWPGLYAKKGGENGKESFSERQQRNSRDALSRLDAHLDGVVQKVVPCLPDAPGERSPGSSLRRGTGRPDA